MISARDTALGLDLRRARHDHDAWPGVSCGGLVRRRNVLAITMQSFISMGVVTIMWVAAGYSLAFSGTPPSSPARSPTGVQPALLVPAPSPATG